ncbi:MAG: iron-containing alcohol dehydrogenase [Megamonas funiformis]|uniref:iron-containing alcohol dehydrogenase n=1 Tax=Megamonas funiformis TaxID=437897 RepID=UPI0039913E12
MPCEWKSSDSAVLTNEQTGQKRGLSTPFNRPCFAIMNPQLTYSAPNYQKSLWYCRYFNAYIRTLFCQRTK